MALCLASLCAVLATVWAVVTTATTTVVVLVVAILALLLTLALSSGGCLLLLLMRVLATALMSMSSALTTLAIFSTLATLALRLCVSLWYRLAIYGLCSLLLAWFTLFILLATTAL